MLFVAIILAVVGWLAGVWLPWWLLLCVYLGCGLALINTKGMSSVKQNIAIGFFCCVSLAVGFVFGEVTILQVGSLVKVAFTGGY